MAGIATLLAMSAVGCARSHADVAQQRRSLESALAKATLPPGATLDNAHAKFDAGCKGIAECADSDARDAVYSVPLKLPATAPQNRAAACRYFTAALRSSGTRLITVWRGGSASYDTKAALTISSGDSVKPRWIDVTDQVCATGHVDSAVMVDTDGASPAGSAHLVLSLATSGGGLAPGYLSVAQPVGRGDAPAKRTVERLPTDSPPLTPSELAYLRGVADQEFVIAASPVRDGILTESRAVADLAIPPGVTGLRFRLMCSVGDDVSIALRDPKVNAALPSRPATNCTGQPIEIILGAPVPIITVDVSLREHTKNASAHPRPLYGPYTVQVAPVGKAR